MAGDLEGLVGSSLACAGLEVEVWRRWPWCAMWARARRERAIKRCSAAHWSWSKQRWALHEAWAA
ncbi:unnamed protein product [Prunus armeniaca]